jgi:hypothetical protein
MLLLAPGSWLVVDIPLHKARRRVIAGFVNGANAQASQPASQLADSLVNGDRHSCPVAWLLVDDAYGHLQFQLPAQGHKERSLVVV